MAVVTPPPASAWSFVRVTAWSMIVLAIVAMLFGVVQAALALVVFTDDFMPYLLESPEFQGMPTMIVAMFEHMFAIAMIALAMAAITLAAGWGMLGRQRWALWASIAMFWLGALGNLVGIWLHALFLHDLLTHPGDLPEFARVLIESGYWSAQISGAVFGLVFAIGFGWTAWKLGRPETWAEFARP